MTQITWRAPDELADRVRQMAARNHRSVNDFITRVLDAATNPDFAGTEVEQIRERLARAGMLASVPPQRDRRRPDEDALDRARRAAGGGTPLSDLISRDRG
jgi:predicted transcriptional regulator